MHRALKGARRWYRAPIGRAHTFLAAVVVALVAVIGCAPVSGHGSTGSGTPPPTPTMQERRISSLAQQAIGSLAQRVEATYRMGDETAQVTATVAGLVPRTPTEVSAAQERVKIICFRAQEALWTSANGIPLREVTVTVLGTVIDDYGDKITATYGAAVLTAATAARFHWGSLSPDTAWGDYDNMYLAPRFAPNQLYGVTPGAHP